MNSLTKHTLQTFCERFNNFEEAEFRSIDIISPIKIEITLATQDKARDFDWITIKLTFSGVSDARLIPKEKLSFIDTNDGISIIQEEQLFAFGLGQCYNISTIKNSSCYVISNDLKYEEGFF